MSHSRAVVLRRFNEPLVVEEFEVPPPPEDGVVVACRYGGICGTDLHLQQGHLDVPTPLVLGHEGLGVVHELALDQHRDANGAPLSPGDTVMWASSISCGRCRPCRAWHDATLCESRRTYGVNRPTSDEPALSGSWADHICLRDGTTIVKVPGDVDPVAAKVILVGGPEPRLRLAAELGIGSRHLNVVESASHHEVLAQVVDLTEGGADLVIECTGVPSAVDEGLRMVRRGGSYLIVGHYTDGGDAMINPHQIVYRRLDVHGSWAFTGTHLVEYVRMLPRLLDHFDLGRLVTTYPFEDHAKAMRDVANGSVMKAVLATTTRE